jgi:hypothetical protein
MTAPRISTATAPGGWAEIGIYQDGDLVAVVTHPQTGAPWFLHPVGNAPRRRFATRAAAVAAALMLTPALTEET